MLEKLLRKNREIMSRTYMILAITNILKIYKKDIFNAWVGMWDIISVIIHFFSNSKIPDKNE